MTFRGPATGGDEVAVLRLRMVGRVHDPVRARRAAERVLDTELASPDWLPPSAVLHVRYLQARMPRGPAVDLGASGAGASLEAAARRAARPADEPVPADAPAVVFTDEAELLACLARDWCSGSLHQRWWWTYPDGGERQVPRAWASAPDCLPAALARLADWGVAVSFAAALTSGEARELIGLVGSAFGLDAGGTLGLGGTERRGGAQAGGRWAGSPHSPARPRRAPAHGGDTGGPARGAGVGTGAGSAAIVEGVVTGTRGGGPTGAEADPPWRPWVAEADSYGLEPAQQAFLGVGLLLRRAPAEARAPGFAAAAMRWSHRRAAAAGSAEPTRTTGSALATDPAETPRPTVTARRTGTAGPAETAERVRGAEDGDPDGAAEAGASTRLPAAAVDGSAEPSSTPAPTGPTGTTRSALVTEPAEAAQTPTPSPAGRRGPEIDDEPAGPTQQGAAIARPSASVLKRASGTAAGSGTTTMAGAGHAAEGTAPAATGRRHAGGAGEGLVTGPVTTRYGGLLYLLDVATALGLYGDFTEPRRQGVELDPWDLIALLGGHLLPKADRADPVWGLLRHLAGRRDGEPPGHRFVPADDWRVPREWLEPFDPGGDWRWSAAAGRLRVCHPAGFCAIDVARDRDLPDRQMTGELARLTAAALPAGVLPPGARLVRRGVGAPVRGPTPLDRWIERLAAYVLARLALALRPGGESPASLLLVRPADVHVTPTRVDAVYRLSDHPVAIRLAGLDRDPGWLPAAGRSIAFHFR